MENRKEKVKCKLPIKEIVHLIYNTVLQLSPIALSVGSLPSLFVSVCSSLVGHSYIALTSHARCSIYNIESYFKEKSLTVGDSKCFLDETASIRSS